jgi:hypothetical protein
MGWCQADLARHLKCDVEVVSRLESGKATLETAHCRILGGILHQAESAAEKTLRRPVAEIIMRDRGISQIHDLEVIESLAEAERALSL